MTHTSDTSTNGSPTVPNASPTVPNASANASPDRLATVVEAAEILCITPDAVRSRLRRGTLKRSPKRGEEGEVLVTLPAPSRTSDDQSQTVGDQSNDQSGDQSATDRDASPTVALVEAMQERIEHLSRIIDTRDDEIRRRDTIIMTLTQRIPELEAPRGDSPETPDAYEGEGGGRASEDQKPEKRSWLHRFFFGT